MVTLILDNGPAHTSRHTRALRPQQAVHPVRIHARAPLLGQPDRVRVRDPDPVRATPRLMIGGGLTTDLVALSPRCRSWVVNPWQGHPRR